MNYISMLNPYSFKYLWQNECGKNYINKLVNKLLNKKENYELLDFFNTSFNSVRSYIILESDESIVIIDFNLNGRNIDDDLAIISFLEASTTKNIYLIMFYNFKGKNSFNNNIYNYFKDDSYIFNDSYDKQYQNNKTLTKYLYSMDEEYIKLYNHELELLSQIN